MELKPCTCGSTDIELQLAVRVTNLKGVFRYQCKKCKKAAYAWNESAEMAAEIWNDTVQQHSKNAR